MYGEIVNVLVEAVLPFMINVIVTGILPIVGWTVLDPSPIVK